MDKPGPWATPFLGASEWVALNDMAQSFAQGRADLRAAIDNVKDPRCVRCGDERSIHSIEPPYDTSDCPGFSYV